MTVSPQCRRSALGSASRLPASSRGAAPHTPQGQSARKADAMGVSRCSWFVVLGTFFGCCAVASADSIIHIGGFRRVGNALTGTRAACQMSAHTRGREGGGLTAPGAPYLVLFNNPTRARGDIEIASFSKNRMVFVRVSTEHCAHLMARSPCVRRDPSAVCLTNQ